jgi:hypothetical protein
MTIERIGDRVYASSRPLPHRPIYDHDRPEEGWDWAVQIDLENGTNLVLRHETEGWCSVSLWVTSPDADCVDAAAKIERRNGEQVVVPLVGAAELIESWHTDDPDGPEVWHYLEWIGRMPVVHPTAQMMGRRAR